MNKTELEGATHKGQATRKVQIHVTRKHIDRAIPFNPDSCALALAIGDAVPLAEISVGVGELSFWPIFSLWFPCSEQVELPKRAERWRTWFDLVGSSRILKRLLVWPISFELDVPTELLPRPKPEAQPVSSVGNSIGISVSAESERK